MPSVSVMASSVTRWLPHDEHRGPPRAACWVSEPSGTGACGTRAERGDRRVRVAFAGAGVPSEVSASWDCAVGSVSMGSVVARLVVRGMFDAPSG